MTNDFVDRGQPIAGMEETVRDLRLPHNFLRSIKNYSIPDQRLRRRPGYGLHATNPFKLQMLSKATGTAVSTKNGVEEGFKDEVLKTPQSYGLLRWHSDYQLKTTQDKTIEFVLRLGAKETLVTSPFERRAKNTGGATGSYDVALRQKGVYVLDQTILSNEHQFNTGTVAVPGTTITLAKSNLITDNIYDAFPLTTLAVAFTETDIWVLGGLVEKSGGTAGVYWPNEIKLQHSLGSTYAEGNLYHIAIVYDQNLGTFGRISLFINGVAANTTPTYDIPGAQYGFVGEYDDINGKTYATGIQRDIVLLNECTVRGSYASACAIYENGTDGMHGHQIFSHNYDTDPAAPAIPWCLSPPKGTAMASLRFWDLARTTGNIQADMWRYSPADETSLVDRWNLDDGVGLCKNQDGTRNITIHHGYPTYVDHPLLLHKLGLSIADGQHLKVEFPKKSGERLIADAEKSIASAFLYQTQNQYQERASFTFQMQVVLPYTFQQEINDDAGKTADQRDVDGTETARTNMGIILYPWEDGASFPGGKYVISATDGTGATTHRQFPRAYDQTLFSLEGTKVLGTSQPSNDDARFRIPLVRGLLTPDRRVVFELFTNETVQNQPLYYRLVGNTQLTAGNTYTLTFVKRPVHNSSTGGTTLIGFRMEIWIHPSGGSASLDNFHEEQRVPLSSVGGQTITPTSSPILHDPQYDLLVGASYVNNGWDKSISTPFATTLPSTTPRFQGPWKVPQHFMTPYQDQPGFFTLGFFRFWTAAITPGEVDLFGFASISRQQYSAQLLFNIELEEITGTVAKNKSRFPTALTMGFKSWGAPQMFRDAKTTAIGTSLDRSHLHRSLLPGGWGNEDSLGYLITTSSNWKNEGVWPFCTLLAPFQTTLTQAYGLIFAFRESLGFDNELEGNMQQLHIQSKGLLTEFAQKSDWFGTPIGDRTILTSSGGVPKVFNGKTCTSAGFREWTGGVPHLEIVTGGGAVTPGWHGVRIVYYSEDYAIEHISPVSTINVGATTSDRIAVVGVPPHPDPRVTSIRYYMTRAQQTEDLARNAPLFLSKEGVEANLYAPFKLLAFSDTDLFPAPLNTNQTPLPICSYSAALSGKLYLGGDVLNPDQIYFSDSNNPERFDTIENFLRLEEGSGDKVTGMVAAFGALFVFKPNSIWRIDQFAGNQHQQTRVASVGAISDKSLLVVHQPETGRVLMVFWSQHGPYVFDGSTVSYIGSPVERIDDAGVSRAEFDWIDSSSVVGIHDVKNREVLFLYTPKEDLGGGNPVREPLDRRQEAVVFNYRYGSWTRYTGLRGRIALSQSFTGNNRIGVIKTGNDRAPSQLEFTFLHKAFIGGENGHIFTWGEALLDGVSGVISNPYIVLSWVAGTRTITATTTITTLNNATVWVTIRRPSTGEWVTAPIEKNEGSNTFVLEAAYVNEWGSFVPQNLDEIYFGFVPAELEFPWDNLGVPMFDKELVELITWHNQSLCYKFAKNYDEATFTSWVTIADQAGQRKRTQIKQSLEAFKLKLCSFALESEVDAYGYDVKYLRGKSTTQS